MTSRDRARVERAAKPRIDWRLLWHKWDRMSGYRDAHVCVGDRGQFKRLVEAQLKPKKPGRKR